ncbi:MAG TPA: PilN domain-containing protein [Gemmatimonadota bacterium]|nr:PilN domain-containing protein [Gemmatimonadota bacterium]
MVRINLVPGERRSKERRRSRPVLAAGRLPGVSGSPSVLGGVAGLVVLLGLVFFYFSERRGLAAAEAAIVDAQADSIRLHGTIVRVRALEEAQERLAARVGLLDAVVNGRLYWLQLLETFSRALPEYTWLERIDQEELAPDQVRIAGATFANAAVTEYMRALDASPLLKDITLVGVTRGERDSINIQGFTLLGSFENFAAIVVTPADSTGAGGRPNEGGR